MQVVKSGIKDTTIPDNGRIARKIQQPFGKQLVDHPE